MVNTGQNEIIKTIDKRDLKRFTASFLSHNNRHLKSMSDQSGFGNAERHALSCQSPSRLLTGEDFDYESKFMENIFDPVQVKSNMKKINKEVTENPNKICLYDLNNPNRNKLLSSQSNKRRVKPRFTSKVQNLEKPKSQERTRASLNTYFALKSQDKPILQAVTLYGGFKNQDLLVFYSFYSFYFLFSFKVLFFKL